MPFPTRVRVRISSKLSYPVGAELITAELEHVPQAESFEISFCSKYETMETRGKAYRIFTVSYLGEQSFHFKNGWSIEVRPVPRALKHAVKEALKREFFPRIRQWLQEYADLDSRYGVHSLSVVMDEGGDTLLKLEEHHTSGEALSN